MNGSKKFKLFTHKKHKVTPVKESLSLEDLTTLVRRLSVQIDDIESQVRKPIRWIMDPYATSVPEDYASLIKRLETSDPTHLYFTVESAGGIPWPEPHTLSNPTPLEAQYVHWCTLLRCLPWMDHMTAQYVKTMALYAMRDILASNPPNITSTPPDIPNFPNIPSHSSSVISPPKKIPSPVFSHDQFSKWSQYKHKKRLTDKTPSLQNLRKIGSWFF